jgi:hypothetical protein
MWALRNANERNARGEESLTSDKEPQKARFRSLLGRLLLVTKSEVQDAEVAHEMAKKDRPDED